VATRIRVAASACLVASGLLIGGAGGAMALADPGAGHDHSDDGRGGDSIGDVVRRAFTLDGGNAPKAREDRGRPTTRWGNGRDDPSDDQGPTKTATQTMTGTPTKTPTKTSPCPDPTSVPGQPPGNPAPEPPASGGGGAIVHLPRFTPPRVPAMELPEELQPGQPGGPAVLDAAPGAAAAPVGPAAPIAVPVIVAPPIGAAAGAGGGAAGAGSAGVPPAPPRAVIAEPPGGRVSLPANAGSKAVSNPSYRIGYTDYLRTAALPQVAALAVPGLVGILVLTGAGGLVGYRQAKAGHAVRVGSSARFMR
jgi:hypothetical protein